MNSKVYLPWRKAIAWILLSTVLISGSVAASLLYWRYLKQKRTLDPRYSIVAIIQACRGSEPLQTDYLAELLNLSVDRVTNLYVFNVEEAKRQLLSCPIIKSAEVKKIFPSMVYVNYALRKPLAYLGDYSNAAIDADGWVFSSKPFSTPKNVPELFLGLSDAKAPMGKRLQDQKITLAKKIIKAVSKLNETLPISLRKVDVSKSISKKYGKREIVLWFENSPFLQGGLQFTAKKLCVVRFSPDNWESQFERYVYVHEGILAGKYEAFAKVKNRYVVDMRISQLAYIGE